MTFASGGPRLWVCLAAGLLAGACEPPRSFEPRASRAEIVGGVTEPSHWYVVMVGSSSGGSCTGTLLSRRTVITAGHCRQGSFSLTRVYFDLGNPLVRTSVATAGSVRHPQYNGAMENDLTLVQLAQDAPIQAVPLLRETMSNAAEWIGPKYTFVGFGNTDATGAGFGTRRVVSFPIDLIGPSAVTHAGPPPAGSPTAIDGSEWYYQQSGKNTCFGDSGGPAFIVRNGVERHAGATSYGDSDCSYDGVQAKTDATTLAWIQQTIDAWEGTTDPCRSDGVCGASCVSTLPVPVGTLRDPDCADQHCAGDGVCVLSCAVADPDCASLTINDCAENGICEANCLPADVDCAVGSKVLGTTCSVGSDCASGFCAGNRCCDRACNGACEACGSSGGCGLKPAATVCRPEAGSCDVPEACTGASPTCPVDLFAAVSVCRPTADSCDVPESCTGTQPACPPDGFLPATATCRPGAGPCDRAEACTGATAACPADLLEQAGTFCRPSLSSCDLPEACDGVQLTCPSDAVAAAGSVCRPANGQCDLAEQCTGTAECPPDLVAPSGVLCRSPNSQCDLPETCSGFSNVCPGDQIAANGTDCTGGKCSSGVCAVPVVPPPFDAGAVRPDAGAGTVDGGAQQPTPPRGCGCAAGGELLFGLAALPLLVRPRRRRSPQA
ncbi:MAG: Secreted trypsin-like serine protease [Myxococcaceae bacterium]|nr:Secreted trypsin-like serine protease [Myxococcaceae bacterium]